MKILKFLPFAMAAGIALTGCGSASDLDGIRQASFLNVGVTMYEPMDYYDEDVLGFIHCFSLIKHVLE